VLRRWRQGLRANLLSDTAQASIGALAPDERRPVEEFLRQSDDAPDIPPGFAEAAVQALRGIEAVTLPADALVDALKAGGLPCTLDELQRRFATFVQAVMRGHDARSSRLTIAE